MHQFRNDMLPYKQQIRGSATVDVVLNMDGLGSRALKRSSYRAIMAQGPLAFAGIKLFYKQDTNLFAPADVMTLRPTPSVDLPVARGYRPNNLARKPLLSARSHLQRWSTGTPRSACSMC